MKKEKQNMLGVNFWMYLPHKDGSEIGFKVDQFTHENNFKKDSEHNVLAVGALLERVATMKHMFFKKTSDHRATERMLSAYQSNRMFKTIIFGVKDDPPTSQKFWEGGLVFKNVSIDNMYARVKGTDRDLVDYVSIIADEVKTFYGDVFVEALAKGRDA